MPACLSYEPVVQVKCGSVHCEGVKGATADFVCFHCTLVASAEAKSPSPQQINQLRDTPYNCAQTIHVIPADQNFEKERNSSALFAREINLVTQPSFDCEQGINSQVQTVCSNADAVFPVLGIVFCKNERFSLLRKTHVPLWNAPRISHVRSP